MAHSEAETVVEVESATPGGPPDRRSGRILLRLAAAGAAGAALLWTVVAVLCASRGLDITDESFYLLSYRWWNDNFDNFTGAQYVYGPVFELLGYDIARLRVFKVLTLLVAHGLFGWAFMRWLRLQRPDAPDSRWWEAAGTAAIVACAGIVYSWLPLSPGYNDLALTCSVLAAGAALRIVRDIGVGARPPWWAPFGFGALAVVMVLGKWSSSALALTVIGLTVVVVAATGRQGWRRFLLMVGLALVGALATLGFIDVLLVPLATLLPPLLEVNSLVAESSNSPADLLSRYWLGATELMEGMVREHLVLLVAAVVLPFVRGARRLVVAVAAVALGVSVVQVVRYDGVMAGAFQLSTITVTVYTPLVVAGLAGLAHVVSERVRLRDASWRGTVTRERVGRAAVFVLLVALPVAQAAGTGNPVHLLAMMGLGVWMAAAIMILTAVRSSAAATRTLIAGALAGLVLATSLIAVDGLWNRPYRTTGHDASTTVAADVPALESVRLDPETAREFSGLRALLEPYIEPSGRAMMGFDGLSGVVLLLDGRPVGEAWYPGGEFAVRSAAGIRRACEDGDPWWGDRTPLVLFNRPATRREHRALASCDLSLAEDYRVLTFPGIRGGDLTIYVPKDEG